MRQAHHTLVVSTPGRGLVSISAEVEAWLRGLAPKDGLLTLFIRHTSASLVVQENADPDVRADLERFFARLVPDGDELFHHDAEGPDDMPAHVRAALTAVQVSVPVRDGQLQLGTWQGVYVYEHRRAPHKRHVALCYQGT